MPVVQADIYIFVGYGLENISVEKMYSGLHAKPADTLKQGRGEGARFR